MTSPFKVASSQGERIYTPESLGWNRIAQKELSGGNSIEDAAKIFDNVLHNTATEAQLNCVIANAAFAIVTLEPEIELNDAIEQATDSIKSGRALSAFERFVQLNN